MGGGDWASGSVTEAWDFMRPLRPAAPGRQASCHHEPCLFSGLMSGSQLVPEVTR